MSECDRGRVKYKWFNYKFTLTIHINHHHTCPLSFPPAVAVPAVTVVQSAARKMVPQPEFRIGPSDISEVLLVTAGPCWFGHRPSALR